MARSPTRFQSQGPQDKHRIRSSFLNRDARPTSQRISDYLSVHTNLAKWVAGTGCVVLVFPGLFNFAVLFQIALLFWWHHHPEKLDIRLPAGAGGIDTNDPAPGRRKFRKPRGIFPIGNNSINDLQIWLSREDLLTHILIFGTTGAGKSYSLTGLAANYLAMGGGLIYVDAKAASSLTRDVHSIACYLGRDDHFMVINLITGNRTINSRSREKFSNTFNFMVFGSAASIADVMISLLGASGEDSNSVFKDNAINLMTTALLVLVDLRDNKLTTLGPNILREWLTLEKLMAVSDICAKGCNNGNPMVTNKRLVSAIRPETMETLNSFLRGLPSFDASKAHHEQDAQSTQEQFGYAKMYWNRTLNMLADTYRHIFWTDVADVDMRDVIMRRRILVVLLPALEKAPADLLALGKIILSALKAAVSTGLSASLIGPRKEIDRPMPACPGGIILDEYAYINTPGFAVMPAQARGLGIGLIFAGQDFAGFKRADENEAMQIISNTTIKIAMRLEDADVTFALFKSAAGDAKVSQVAGFSTEGAVLANYVGTGSISLESVPRIDFNDFREAIEGEAFLFYRSRIVTITMFSHEIKKNNDALFFPVTRLPIPFFPSEPYNINRRTAMEAMVFMAISAAGEKHTRKEDEVLASSAYGTSYDLSYSGAMLEAVRHLPQWQVRNLTPADFVMGTAASTVELSRDKEDIDSLRALVEALRDDLVLDGDLVALRPMVLSRDDAATLDSLAPSSLESISTQRHAPAQIEQARVIPDRVLAPAVVGAGGYAESRPTSDRGGSQQGDRGGPPQGRPPSDRIFNNGSSRARFDGEAGAEPGPQGGSSDPVHAAALPGLNMSAEEFAGLSALQRAKLMGQVARDLDRERRTDPGAASPDGSEPVARQAEPVQNPYDDGFGSGVVAGSPYDPSPDDQLPYGPPPTPDRAVAGPAGGGGGGTAQDDAHSMFEPVAPPEQPLGDLYDEDEDDLAVGDALPVGDEPDWAALDAQARAAERAAVGDDDDDVSPVGQSDDRAKALDTVVARLGGDRTRSPFEQPIGDDDDAGFGDAEPAATAFDPSESGTAGDSDDDDDGQQDSGDQGRGDQGSSDQNHDDRDQDTAAGTGDASGASGAGGRETSTGQATGREDGEAGAGDFSLSQAEQDRLMRGGDEPEDDSDDPSDDIAATQESAARRGVFNQIGEKIGVGPDTSARLDVALTKPIYPEAPIEPAVRTPDMDEELRRKADIIARSVQRVRKKT